MEFELSARDVVLSDQVREYVDVKVGRLDRHLSDIRSTRVELRHGVKRSMGEVYTTQITARVDKSILRAEEMHSDLFASIDLAADKLMRQVDRLKGKRLKRWHSGGEPQPEIEEDFEDEDDLPRIFRRKTFEVYSMDEEEAVDQIELLGHDFFLYRDGGSGEINVLYRRKDGLLGLIVPISA